MGDEDRRVRVRRATVALMDSKKVRLKREQSARLRKLTRILRKSESNRTNEEKKIIEEYRPVIGMLQARINRSIVIKERLKELEDPIQILENKCEKLANMIRDAKNLIVYAGAGISTSAQIPDYRGPNGVWTQLHKNGHIPSTVDLTIAEPTYTHMALTKLYNNDILKHIVSQNCDGLHLRSGFPQCDLSEIHGNMYIEVCNNCKRQYIRDFDVTQKTNLHRHKTGRFCQSCISPQGELIDTIVHFREKGCLEWPLNWLGAQKACKEADLIICLGSSLKILRRYSCLWPKKVNNKPEIVIVNLQWTPKDSQAKLKINGRCDMVMQLIMKYLSLNVETYNKDTDALLPLYTPLTSEEEKQVQRLHLFGKNISKDELAQKCKPAWFGKGLRSKKR